MTSLPPLTHHEILELAEPLVRRGRSVDLAASDRSARELAFRARAVDASGGVGALTETLRLSPAGSGGWKLTRTLVGTDGLESVLLAEGDDIARLADEIDTVPASRQRPCAAGVQLALSHRLAARRGADSARP